jgi:4-hydroxy-tetrahydrodipicolinate reductase
MTAFKIGVVGAAGRMGQMLVREVAATEGCLVAGGTERPGSPALGRDLGELAGLAPLGVAIGDDANALFRSADAVLDFTAPAASLAHAKLAAKHRKIHVVGTTGLDAAGEAAIAEAGKSATIVRAPNMSLGVNLALLLVEEMAGALGPDWDIEILEMHHRHKVDAPSGTALGLGRAAAKGRGVRLDQASERGRDGITGARKAGAIGFAALRGGDVVGEHRVIFAGAGERIELAHIATDRVIYAKGAIRAALWARGKPPGLYGMKDVLGL